MSILHFQCSGTKALDHLGLSFVLLLRPSKLFDRPRPARPVPCFKLPKGLATRGCALKMNSQTIWSSVMTLRAISAAMERLTAILRRRPEFGLQDDEPATARWERGLRIVSSHKNGTQLATDMPAELGGSGDQVAPGWLMRAGLASCAATRIAMAAAVEEIDLAMLEVSTRSRSDTRGLFGMSNADGTPVDAGPCDVEMIVRISALGVTPERLRTLVEESHRCSPVSNAFCHAVPISLRIDIDAE